MRKRKSTDDEPLDAELEKRMARIVDILATAVLSMATAAAKEGRVAYTVVTKIALRDGDEDV